MSTSIRSKVANTYAGLGYYYATVGDGGNISDLADINEVIPALELLDTFTGTSSTGSKSYHHVISDDASGAISGVSNKQMVGVRLGGTGPILRGYVANNSTGIIHLMNPLYVAFTSVQVDVYAIRQACVEIMPGERLDLQAGTNISRDYLSLYSKAGSGTLVNTGSSSITFENRNEITLDGINFTSDYGNNSSLSYCIQLEGSYSTDTYIKNCNFNHRASDSIFCLSTYPAGGVVVQNCQMSNYYDAIRLSAHRYAIITNNRLFTYGTEFASDESACIALGSTVSGGADLPIEKYFISNNLLEGHGHVISDGCHVKGIDFRNILRSNAVAFITGNHFYLEQAGGTRDVTGVYIGSSALTGTETPTINCLNNVFDCSNGGTGGALSMDSDNASYVLNRANNVQIGSTAIGANTTSISASLV